MTVPDRISSNVWEVFVNTELATDASLTAGPGVPEFYPGPVGHSRVMALDRHQNFGSA